MTTAQSITTYRYDPLGRRLSKVTNDTSHTLYARDPQGNALANYRSAKDADEQQGCVNPAGLVLSELVIYGSSRIGIINLDAKASPEPEGDNSGGGGTIDPQNPDEEYNKRADKKNLNSSFLILNSQESVIFTEVLGLRRYELANHLGNVLCVVTDRIIYQKPVYLRLAGKVPVYVPPGTIQTTIPVQEPLGEPDWQGFDPDIASASDYHGYGMAMTGRIYAAARYEYGQNTQMKSPELAEGHYTAEFWEYDSRIARRWEMDPIFTADFSRYAVNGDNPIVYTDPNGDFKTKLGAWVYKLFNGGDKIEKATNGEYFVGTDVEYKGGDDYVSYKRRFDWSGRSKEQNSNVGQVTESTNPFKQGSFSHFEFNHGGAYGSKVEAYRAWRDEPGYHEGESWGERTSRIQASNAWEIKRDWVSGGYNTAGSFAGSRAISSSVGARVAGGVDDVAGGGRLVGFGSDAAIVSNTASLIPKRGWFDVVVHGTEDGLAFVVNGVRTTPQQLYSNMLASGYQQGTRIRLMSCYAGSLSDGAAHQLSKLANAGVMAPTNTMWIANGSGFLPMGLLKVDGGGCFKFFK